MGSVQPRARYWIRATDQKPMASISTSECSDTSNLARSAIRRVIFVNESPSGFHVEFIYQFGFSQAEFDTPPPPPLSLLLAFNLLDFVIELFYPRRRRTSKSGRETSPRPKLNGRMMVRTTPTFREVTAQRSDKGVRHETRR